MFSFRLPTRAAGRLGVLIWGLANSGCSFLFVTPPPARAEQASERDAECTTGPVAPVVDGLIAGYHMVHGAYATRASEHTFVTTPISREADVVWDVGMTSLFLASAIYGGVYVSQCRDFKERFQPASPPPSAAVPPTAPPPVAPSPFTAVPPRNGGSPP